MVARLHLWSSVNARDTSDKYTRQIIARESFLSFSFARMREPDSLGRQSANSPTLCCHFLYLLDLSIAYACNLRACGKCVLHAKEANDRGADCSHRRFVNVSSSLKSLCESCRRAEALCFLTLPWRVRDSRRQAQKPYRSSASAQRRLLKPFRNPSEICISQQRTWH